MGPRLVLGRDQLIPLIQDAGLYAACPEYAAVQQHWLEVQARWQQSVREDCCGGDPRILFPALDEFMVVTSWLLQQPEGLARFRGFLGRKYHSAATVVAIYYRKTQAGQPARVQF